MLLFGSDIHSKTNKNAKTYFCYLTGVIQTDSSSDEESSEAEEESDLEHEWGELDADAETTEESTRRYI